MTRRFTKVDIDLVEKEKKSKRLIIMAITVTLIALISLVGTTYAMYSFSKESDKTLSITTGTFKIEFNEGNSINLDNLYPMSDSEGMDLDSYHFTIKNTGSIKATYRVRLEEDIDNTLIKKYIKYSLKINNKWTTPNTIDSLDSNLVLISNKTLTRSMKDEYELKMWLSSDATNEIENTLYKAKILVESYQNTNIDMISPTININGLDNITIDKDSIFTDPGIVSVTDNIDVIDTSVVEKYYEYYDGSNTSNVNYIDTSKVGVYYVYYKVKDSSLNEGVTVRVVNVKEKNRILPVINLIGDKTINIPIKSSYKEYGYNAFSLNNGDITNNVFILGNVNSDNFGTFIIKYIVKDNSNNIYSVIRKVIVS